MRELLLIPITQKTNTGTTPALNCKTRSSAMEPAWSITMRASGGSIPNCELALIRSKDKIFIVFVSPISNLNDIYNDLPELIFDKKYFNQ
jgi:hypothetical protein